MADEHPYMHNRSCPGNFAQHFLSFFFFVCTPSFTPNTNTHRLNSVFFSVFYLCVFSVSSLSLFLPLSFLSLALSFSFWDFFLTFCPSFSGDSFTVCMAWAVACSPGAHLGLPCLQWGTSVRKPACTDCSWELKSRACFFLRLAEALTCSVGRHLLETSSPICTDVKWQKASVHWVLSHTLCVWQEVLSHVEASLSLFTKVPVFSFMCVCLSLCKLLLRCWISMFCMSFLNGSLLTADLRESHQKISALPN